MFQCFDFFKDIGNICGHVPFTITHSGKWSFLAVALENTFHTYSAEELRLHFTSQQHPSKILHISADPYNVVTATATSLRSTSVETNEFEEIELDSPPTALISVEPYVILVQDTKFTAFYSRDLVQHFQIDTEKQITAIIHPLAQINKFLVAFSDRTMQLWNVRTNQVIYTFKGFTSIITKIVQSPHPDIFALICADNRVIMFNFKTDESLFSFKHASPVASVDFRQDGPPHLVVGLMNGEIIVYDLQNRQLYTTIKTPHTDLHSVVCMRNNLFITGGSDNSLRQWAFDEESSNVVRLHRFRVGHGVPPSDGTFLKVNGEDVFVSSSGTSKLITCDILNETSANIVSTAPLNERHLTHNLLKIAKTDAHRYASLATLHENSSIVFLWDIDNNRFSRRALTAAPKNGVKVQDGQTISFGDFNLPQKATSIYLTRCGNFGVLGNNEGNVMVFSTQSARLRGSIEKKHDSEVTFVFVDPSNTVIVSGDVTGIIYVHDFDTFAFMDSFEMPEKVFSMSVHPNGVLLALLCEKSITVFDCVSLQITRKFNVKPSAASFSHDGKFLFVSDREKVYLYDFITSLLIEEAKTESEVKCFAVHPGGDVVITLHKDSLAVKLWYFRSGNIKSAKVELTEQSNGLIEFSQSTSKMLKEMVNPPRDVLRYPRAKTQLPFFITAALETVEKPQSDITRLESIRPLTDFAALLKENPLEAFDRLKSMKGAELQNEVAALGSIEGVDERILFIQMLIEVMESKREYDLVQAVMRVFLMEHGSGIIESEEGKSALNELLDMEKETIQFIDDDLSHSLCLIQLISHFQ